MKILLLGEFSGFHNQIKVGLLKQGCDVTIVALNDYWKKIPVDISLGYGSNLISYKLRQLFLPLLDLGRLKGYDVVHLMSFYMFQDFLSQLFFDKIFEK